MKLLHSRIVGEGSREMVVLHGFLGMGDNWRTHAKNWSELGFKVHLVDQRNHGKSFWSNAFNYDVLSDDLVCYFDEKNIENAIVLGHSMGGKTAMTFACVHPERVNQLIVADIAPRVYPSHHHQILKGLASLDFEKINARQMADKALSNFVTDLGTRQFLLKNLYWKSSGKLGLRLNIEVLKTKGGTVVESLPANYRFEKPTLFLSGSKSDYILPDDHIMIERHFPMAEIVEISNAGHWLHAENPVAFSQEMLKWIDRYCLK